MDFKSSVLSLFSEYLTHNSWEIKENSNMLYSLGGLTKFIIAKLTEIKWEELYDKVDKRIMEYHKIGDFHIHDLGSYSSYCYGSSMRNLLERGIKGVKNLAVSKPAKHFQSACAQIANITTIYQNENAGAIAYSSVNVYLAPFIYFDILRSRGIEPTDKKIEISYTNDEIKSIKQSIQNMVFALNSNSRHGSESSFSNFTLDFNVLTPMKDLPVIVGGEYHPTLTYKDFQTEADLFLNLFVEVLLDGDGEGKILPYPIPTFNISKNMNWDKYDKVFELAAKTGAPYFGNFLHGSLNEEDIYSMCCRLRLDKKELLNKTGGLFGAAENTGSIGVLTINLPAIGYVAKDKEHFFNILTEKMEVGYKHLEEKRRIITQELDNGLFPAMSEYLPRKFDTFFSSFGIIGLHEMCLNFLGCGIDTKEGINFSLEVIRFMKDKLKTYQDNSGNLYNLEYTPAESTAYRLALKDKARFENIIQSGTPEIPYYTNSCHLPVGIDWSWDEIFRHQEKLLPEATGGSVYHCYLEQATDMETAKHFIKTTLENYNIPYLSLSPRFSVCNNGCGVLKGHQQRCEFCGGDTEIYQRITGYIRRIKGFNLGKLQEYNERYQRKL